MPARPDPPPVAALNYALTEAGREALGYAPEGGLQGVAQKAMLYLTERGYVLVNADMLAEAIPDEFSSFVDEEDDGEGDYLMTFNRERFAAAILAAIQEQTDDQ